ncbi:MAG: Gfo/Idh/MocA family oxidoreductase [Pirellulaceae bacterium]
MTSFNRRTFLEQAAACGVAMGMATTVRAASANDKVTTALIGCGGRGQSFLSHCDFVCDVDRNRLGQTAEKGGIDSKRAVTDLRRILDNKDIDAVVVATPDHWHAPAAIMACEAGKHVYVEKPCSHNFRESRLLLDAARRNNVVVQHGTQQRSTPFTMAAIESLREGIIGDVLIAKAWNIQRRDNIGHAEPGQPPAHVDYDTWVGPAEFLPYQANRFHYDWHWWYNFGTGDIGNDGAHEVDYARWGLGVDSLPRRVVGLGGKYFHQDDQQFPDTATCVFEYPDVSGAGKLKQLMFEMRLWSGNYPYNCDSGVEFLGTAGKMVLSKRGRLIVFGPDNRELDGIEPQPRNSQHFEDFVDAIRNGRRPHADIEEAHRSVSLIHLANIAVRTGRSLEFNLETETIVDDPDAHAMLGRKYRDAGHWSVPNFA